MSLGDGTRCAPTSGTVAARRLLLAGIVLAATPLVLAATQVLASPSERDLGAGMFLTGVFLLCWSGAVGVWITGAIAAALAHQRRHAQRTSALIVGGGNALLALAAALLIYRFVYVT